MKSSKVRGKVRFGIVGMGNMGNQHARIITEDRSRQFELAAIADWDEAKRPLGEKFSVPFFAGAEELLDSGLIDAVLIAVPHYFHRPLTYQAARRGIHVLCEKPLSSSVGEARDMIAECRRRKVVLGAMLQQRTRPVMKKMKQMVDRGAIGEVFRVQMICSSWFRTQAYYDSGAWRGTWDGEGGGVLINQAPHSLDLFQWIGMGLPKTITASLATREHKIEVEDTANLICDYGQGRIGYIYATTAEEPGMEQLMVIGDKGTLIAEGKTLRYGKLSQPISKHIYGSKHSFAGGGEMKLKWTDVKIPDAKQGHIEITRAFARHLLTGSPLVATAEEAINELEISNAAYLSGFADGRPVSLPVDAAAMERLLNRLVRQRSTGKGGDFRRAAAKEMKRILAKK